MPDGRLAALLRRHQPVLTDQGIYVCITCWHRRAGHPVYPCSEAIAISEIFRVELPEPERPCKGFQWLGQSFATCERCGLPYWVHTHEEVVRRDVALFDLENAFDLVAIHPDNAAACRRKWGSDVHQVAS